MKRAQWFISEQGFNSLMVAGISTGWLKAWLFSAGAGDVSIHLLESGGWHDCQADFQLFFATDNELLTVMQQHGYSDMPKENRFRLENPERDGSHYMFNGKHIVLLSVGDIVFQREHWLSLLSVGKPLLPLYVRADDSMPVSLEPGVSAGLSKPVDGRVLNAEGLLIEEQVIAALSEQKLSIRTAESCTAGGIAARLCRVPGASGVVDRAWVTYSNRAKQEEVGVAADLLQQYGAVSEEVVHAMAEGGADVSHICIAISGIAGPGGGSDEKPVGTVWIAVACAGHTTVSRCLHLKGARHEIQSRTVIAALSLLLTEMEKFHR